MDIPQQYLLKETVELEQESLQADDHLERNNNFNSSTNEQLIILLSLISELNVYFVVKNITVFS